MLPRKAMPMPMPRKSGTGQRLGPHATASQPSRVGSRVLFPLFLANNIHCTIMPCLILIPDLNALYRQLIYAVSARQSGERYTHCSHTQREGGSAHAKLFAI